VDVEINIKDDSYAWFLHWMTLYQQSQLNVLNMVVARVALLRSRDW